MDTKNTRTKVINGLASTRLPYSVLKLLENPHDHEGKWFRVKTTYDEYVGMFSQVGSGMFNIIGVDGNRIFQTSATGPSSVNWSEEWRNWTVVAEYDAQLTLTAVAGD